jgi:hypothetical protein
MPPIDKSSVENGHKRGEFPMTEFTVHPPDNAPKSQNLRRLAAWYRAFAERAGNPAIWEGRSRMAEDLDAEAHRLEQSRRGWRAGQEQIEIEESSPTALDRSQTESVFPAWCRPTDGTEETK